MTHLNFIEIKITSLENGKILGIFMLTSSPGIGNHKRIIKKIELGARIRAGKEDPLQPVAHSHHPREGWCQDGHFSKLSFSEEIPS